MATSFYGGNFFGGEFFNAAVAQVGVVPAGRGRRRQQRFVLEVEGRDLVFATVEALFAFLVAREPALETVAKAKAASDARRILQLGSSRVSIRPPALPFESSVPEVQQYLEEVASRVKRAYGNALWAALAQEGEEMEDIAFIATLQ